MENPENSNIPENATEDLPFPDDKAADRPGESPKTENIDPEKRHNWSVENFKNNSAQNIVVLCLLAIFLFAIIQFFWTGADGGDAMAKASDVFKLIATTALGFLFGRNSK